MKRTVHIAKSYKEAEKWDVLQQINMKPEERQKIARELKKRAFGNKNPDVREYHSKR